MALTPFQINHISSLLQHDQEILEIILISNQLLTTGSTKIEYITNIKLTLEELKSTCSVHFIMQVSLILVDCMPWQSSEDSMAGLDTIEIPIYKLIFPKSLQERSCKSYGTELQSLLED
jgi:hypothetical protein